MYTRFFLAILLFFLGAVELLGMRATEEWKIINVSLRPDSAHKLPFIGIPNELIATLSRGTAQFSVSADVRLTALKEYFTVPNDKLAVIGDAGKSSAVVIFDLATKRLLDWFYCYAPQRVSETWIVYVEWYPVHGAGEPKEVVLLYDLTKSPGENRLPGAQRLIAPAPITAAPITVGTPIYPESNVKKKSYVNAAQNSAEAERLLTTSPFLLLPSQRLVFVAAKGQDFPTSWDYLVVVDLSHGIVDPLIQTVDIPKDQFKKPGENPNFIQVTGIEAASPDSVRLFVPRSEYGVSSITVSIP